MLVRATLRNRRGRTVVVGARRFGVSGAENVAPGPKIAEYYGKVSSRVPERRYENNDSAGRRLGALYFRLFSRTCRLFDLYCPVYVGRCTFPGRSTGIRFRAGQHARPAWYIDVRDYRNRERHREDVNPDAGECTRVSQVLSSRFRSNARAPVRPSPAPKIRINRNGRRRPDSRTESVTRGPSGNQLAERKVFGYVPACLTRDRIISFYGRREG